jgi:putative transposase
MEWYAAQRWYCSFTVQADKNIPAAHAWPGTAIGVDLGVRTLLTGVDQAGQVVIVPGPKPLRAGLRRLRRASRAHSRKARGGANRHRAAARLARIHARVANVRADALHKATSSLARQYETVAAEDLNVAGMVRNRRLARAVADTGFGTARRMLGYKTAWHGGQLILADRWYPSSTTCSACGTVKAKLSLSERTFTCQACGHAEDRDVNAARNLLALAASGAESINACRAQVRPGRAGHRAQPRQTGKTQEPGTAPAGKSGTAGPQDPAASGVLIPAY